MSSPVTSSQPTARPHSLHSTNLRALLGYLLLAGLFYAPILLGLRSFPDGDFNEHFLAFSLFQRSEFLAGRLPAWNPYTYAGHPFLADVQAAVFYPLSNLISGLSLPWGDAGARLYWLEAEAALHIALAGFFTYLLTYALTGRKWAAFLAGCAFAFSGYLTGYPPLQLAVLRTAIWLPLVLWLLWRGFEAPLHWKWWVLAAVAYAVGFLAGHSQTFLFLSYAVAGWIALLSWARRSAWRVGSLAPRVIAFYAIALGLGAAQLLPSAEFTRLSVRASSDYAFLSGGFPLQDTWQMLLPGVLTQFSPLYVGIVGLGLALIGVAAAAFAPQTPMFRPGAFYFASLALIALLLSFGDNAFLYPLFYRFAPGFKLFRGQERAAYLVAFGLSVLAGYGAALLWELSPQRRRRWVVAYTLTAVAGVALFALRWQRAGRTAIAPGQFAALAAVALALLVGLLAIAWVREAGRGARAALVALVVADLFIANYATNLDAGGPGQKAALPLEAVATAEAVQAAGGANLGLPGRTYNEYRIFEDWGMRARVEDSWGASPLRLWRYATLFDGFPLERLWRLAGVTHTLTWRRDLPVSADLLAEFPQEEETTYLHRLSVLNPRAWVVEQTRFASDSEAKLLLADGTIDLEHTAVIAPPADQIGGAALPGDGPLAAPGSHSVRLERPAPDRLEIDVDGERGGLLVVSENWMPGWEATVQPAGGPPVHAPVMRADLAFLGMAVGPGQTHITLEYRPLSIRLGLALTVLTLAVLALAWLLRRTSRGRAGLDVRRILAAPGWQTAAILFILLMAFALRVYRLGYQELRGDEALGRLFTQSSIAQFTRDTIALKEPHPVGGYILQKGFWSLAGDSEFAMRFVSAWFGVLAVALLFRLGRGLGFGKSAALLASALLAASPYVIWHSQDARMYTLSLALTLGSTVLLVEALQRGRIALWAGYAAACWLSLNVHYFAVFVLAAHGLFVCGLALADRKERSALVAWLGAQSVVALLYLPWLIAARQTLTGYGGNADSPAFADMLVRALSVFGVGETSPVSQRPLWAFIAGLLLLIAAVRLWRAGTPGRRAMALLMLYLWVPVLATWVSAINRPIFNERYLVAAAPPFFLLLAAAVLGHGEPSAADRAPRLVPVAALLLALLATGAVLSLGRHYADPEYSKTRGWRELARVMGAEAAGPESARVRLSQNFPDPVLWYYTGPAAHLVLPPDELDEAWAQREVQALVDDGVERVVISVQPAEPWDGAGIAEATLSGPYSLVSSRTAGDWDVQTYVRHPDSLSPIEVGFENGVALLEGAVQNERLTPGGLLVPFLAWAGDPAALTGSEKLTLQVLDGAGRLVAQSDIPFGAAELNGAPMPHGIRLPWQLPSGDYRIIAALYDPAREGAPRILTSSGADHVELGVVPGP